MQGRNTIEEVLCLSAQRGYMVFYRNREESNVLSDIVVAHPTSIAMIGTWSYVLIMDNTYKTNKYNVPLLEAVGMTPTGKNFIVATTFMCNEQATTYRRVLQQIKHLYVTYTMSTGYSSILNDGESIMILTDRESKLMPGLDTSSAAFWIETTNRAERKHSVLKLWLSMCHGDLDTVFLNIDSLIEGQIA
ncbi:hypothetical protein M9H77_27394 [Catharanthus roseus]|uniref:Uncharacterized protein n=1 Tax=Catharanthus roseus TaxID=4058 RepID=A0ACC0ACY5_CATRO|nr:hypothetical protein M9H77_27394 [Catharanthus roseus]